MKNEPIKRLLYHGQFKKRQSLNENNQLKELIVFAFKHCAPKNLENLVLVKLMSLNWGDFN